MKQSNLNKSLNELAPEPKLTQEREVEFKQIFGISIYQFHGLLPINLVGIDIIKFDDWISPNLGESCAQAVERKYGKRARQLIEELI